MFRDVDIGELHIASAPRTETAEADVMTDPIAVHTTSAQTEGYPIDNSTQTDSTVRPSNEPRHDEAEQAAVAALLRMVGPIVLHELKETARQNALFTALDRFQEDASDRDVSKLFSLSFDFDTFFQVAKSTSETPSTAVASSPSKKAVPTAPPTLKLSCTGVSWNATGAIIAASYGRFDHSGWCNYRSALCLWHIFDSEFTPNKPTLVLETSSGLMCVAFHPKRPHMVAAGSFNGEVLLWDLDAEEFGFRASTIGDYFHREPVNQVAWVWNTQLGEFEIASVSGDGKVLFWRMRDKLAHPRQGYLMQPRGFVASASTGSPTAHSSPMDRAPIFGGKAIAFSPKDNTSAFVVGSEGGAVLRCFATHNATRVEFKSSEKIKWEDDAAFLLSKVPSAKVTSTKMLVEKYALDHKLKVVTVNTLYDANVDPCVLYPSGIDFSFEMHDGPVHDVSFSPFRNDVFATCSSDGTVRICSTHAKEPLLVVDVTAATAYLYAVRWSRKRPMVFAAAAEDGCVYVFDLKADQDAPVLILSSTSCGTSAPTPAGSKSTTASSAPAMFALDFNPRQRNLLAAGDASGMVHIWKSSYLGNLQSGEESLLGLLGKEG